jgi:hypothetical protein
MAGALLNLGRTLLTGLRAGRTVASAGASQARFTYGHLANIGQAGSTAHRLRFSATMGRRVMAHEFANLTPAAQHALIRTGQVAGVATAGAVATQV